MIPKQLLFKTKFTSNLFSSTIIRTKVFPTPAKVEFIQGKSQIGKPASFEPKRLELEKGKSYSWCACGKSAKQPFCDGAHKSLNSQLKEGEEKFGPLRFVCEESRTALLCNCKSSSNRPFCDGTHETLKKKSSRLDILLN